MKYRINDNELIYMIKENDDSYIESLFKKYEPIIINICNYYYDSLSYFGIDYDDLKQECYIGLYSAYLYFDPNKNITFYTYANACIKRHMKVFYRYCIAKKNSFLNNYIYIEDFNRIDFSYNYEYLDNEYEFVKYKNLLEFRLCNVFELRYNGFSYKEISKLLGISVSTVDSRLCKIRSILNNNRSILL